LRQPLDIGIHYVARYQSNRYPSAADDGHRGRKDGELRAVDSDISEYTQVGGSGRSQRSQLRRLRLGNFVIDLRF
jgi:hypothetical protein